MDHYSEHSVFIVIRIRIVVMSRLAVLNKALKLFKAGFMSSRDVSDSLAEFL